MTLILTLFLSTVQTSTEAKTATIYTDCPMTMDPLKNSKIYTFLIEDIRRKLTEMGKTNWKIQNSNLGFVGAGIFTHSTESTNQMHQLITGLLFVV